MPAILGPKGFKSIWQHLIDSGLSHTYINNQVNRIRRIFKRAVSEELVPPSVYHGLQTVPGLRYGRSTARETAPVGPVADEHVNAILPFVAPPVAAMICLQRLTEMPSGEVVIMRGYDIDASGDVWPYTPSDHKGKWRGQHKVIPLGLRAQAIVERFLKLDTTACLFSPRDAQAHHIAHRSAIAGSNRKTRVFPSEIRRRERIKWIRTINKKRLLRDRYDTAAYRRAIQYGIDRANDSGVAVPHWHPHQLRHTKATEVRKQFGLEAAQIALGHARADVTEVYAERDFQRAIQLARQIG